ncbi:unnamed protein product [Bathycoccus prasinos]
MLESMAVMGYVFSFQNFPVFGRVNQQIGAPKFSAFSTKAKHLECSRVIDKDYSISWEFCQLRSSRSLHSYKRSNSYRPDVAWIQWETAIHT